MRLALPGAGVGLLLLIGPGAPLAQPAPAGPDISVTIYNNNLALVRDVRTLTLTAGRQRLEFRDVSAQIRPETASLGAQGVSVIEQNFDYDLLSPAKMMEKAVGRVVTIVRTSPATGKEMREQAEVLAVNDGVVLKIGERIEVLRDDGLPVRVIFDKVPDNLRAQPTLSVMVDAQDAGVRPVTLSYLTPGLGWRADYVAVYDEGAGKIDVQGWVTLTNTSGDSYNAARTVLVTGTPGLSGANDGDADNDTNSATTAGTESGSRARLGDFYLYPLAERTTIANRQTKQVSFLDVRGAPASHGYEARLAWMETVEQPRSAKSVYRFSNSARGGLGDQLPAGVVRFYINDKQGAPQFIGESPIGHTPMGSALSLATGDAFDVKIKSVVESRQRDSLFHWKTAMRYTLTNALPKLVTVALTQDGLWGETKILAESRPSKRRSASSAEWAVEVPANGKAEVTATFDSKY
jgi:hypothetical protein